MNKQDKKKIHQQAAVIHQTRRGRESDCWNSTLMRDIYRAIP